jgi:hypothetical protein
MTRVSEAVAATVIWRIEQRDAINAAIDRLHTALKYGEDMDSSRLLCIQDAVTLLKKAEFLAKGIQEMKLVRR